MPSQLFALMPCPSHHLLTYKLLAFIPLKFLNTTFRNRTVMVIDKHWYFGCVFYQKRQLQNSEWCWTKIYAEAHDTLFICLCKSTGIKAISKGYRPLPMGAEINFYTKSNSHFEKLNLVSKNNYCIHTVCGTTIKLVGIYTFSTTCCLILG